MDCGGMARRAILTQGAKIFVYPPTRYFIIHIKNVFILHLIIKKGVKVTKLL